MFGKKGLESAALLTLACSASLRPLAKIAGQGTQPSRHRHAVVIDKGDDFAGAFGDAAIAGKAHPRFPFGDVTDGGERLPHHGGGRPVGIVVHHQDVVIRMILGGQRCEATGQGGRAAAGADHGGREIEIFGLRRRGRFAAPSLAFSPRARPRAAASCRRSIRSASVRIDRTPMGIPRLHRMISRRSHFSVSMSAGRGSARSRSRIRVLIDGSPAAGDSGGGIEFGPVPGGDAGRIFRVRFAEVNLAPRPGGHPQSA